MKILNNVAFLMVLLWVAGWTIAACRAGLKFRTVPCPGRREGCAEPGSN